jgi:hypothetical protein
MLKLSFVLSILVLPFADHSIQAQVAETKAGTATVSGRVTLKGEPARGVTVVLQGQNSGASNALRAKSDEGGRFHFTGAAAGRYSVFALMPGYISPEDTRFTYRGKTLNLADGEKVENIDLELKRGGVIAGRITDSQGRPVIEESINLIKLNKPRVYYNFSGNYDMHRTDDRGFYRIYGLAEGRYLVSVGYAESPGSVTIASSREFYPRVFYPNATGESQAKVIEVTEGSEATDIDITVPDPKQTHDVYGRVVDAGTGQPVVGAEVVIGRVSTDGKYTGGYSRPESVSGTNGEFHIFGVLPGKYAIFTGPDELRGSGRFISEPVIFDISEGDATGVEVKVSQGASISGVAVIEGTNDPKVLAKLPQINLRGDVYLTTPGPWSNLDPLNIKVNADGSFRISGLRPGKAVISVILMANPRDLSIARIERNGAPASEGIEVSAGEQVTGVRIVLVQSSLTIRGELKVVGGSLPAGYTFHALARRTDQRTLSLRGAEIDARRQFVIENMPPGEYEIRVEPYFSPDGQPLSPEIRRLISSAQAKVVVSGANQQPVTIVIDLSR